MDHPVILEMKGIVKSFGPVKALKGVDFDLRAGEVHALMGENGAGKSTLMKVLTGIYDANEGTIHYNQQEVVYSKPKEAMDAGIVIVHQELNMMNHLTVAQNIFIGLIKAYRKVISPLYGDVCRYYPTCSAYGLEAFTTHGAIGGLSLTVRRILRCTPWATGGIDPVPPGKRVFTPGEEPKIVLLNHPPTSP